MQYFEHIDNLKIYDRPWMMIEPALKRNGVEFGDYNQICLNTIPGHDTDYRLGIGSLVKEWDNNVVSENGYITSIAEKENQLKEEQFTVLCEQFKGTIIQSIYNELTSKYKVGRVRLMRLKPKTCLTWHEDTSDRIHYPVQTFKGCRMVIEDEVAMLDSDHWWYVKTKGNKHTVFNGSLDDRIHIVASVL